MAIPNVHFGDDTNFPTFSIGKCTFSGVIVGTRGGTCIPCDFNLMFLGEKIVVKIS